MKQFFFLISETNNQIYLRIYITETRVLYNKMRCDTYETAQFLGESFCKEDEFINTEFTKSFPEME